MSEQRTPLPPFTVESAIIKTRLAENAWNSRNPQIVAKAYTENSDWRNRSEFLSGRNEIETFLTRKWTQEQDYRLIKEFWAHHDDRIAVRFAYEWHDEQNQWFRSHGNELWKFDAHGLMERREASINDISLTEDKRLFHWPLGPRPEDHPGLSELGL